MTTRGITQDDLDALAPSRSAVEYPWTEVRQDIVDTIVASAPDWPPGEDYALATFADALAKAADALAYMLVANREARNRVDLDNDVTRAEGEALARIGVGRGVPPQPGEPDAEYRLRIINSRSRRTATVVPSGLRSAVLEFRPESGDWWVASMDYELQPDGETVHIAALKGSPGASETDPYVISDLTDEERGLLQTYLSSDSVQPFFRVYTAVATVRSAYAIAADVRLDQGASWPEVSQAVIDAALAWAHEHDRVSLGFDRLGLQAAMGCVPGVRTCRVTGPAADVADAFAHHHAGPTEESGVVLTEVSA